MLTWVEPCTTCQAFSCGFVLHCSRLWVGFRVLEPVDAPTYIRNCNAENYFQIRVRQISGDFARELHGLPYDLDSLIGNGQGLYAGWSRFDAHPSEVLSSFDEIRAQVLEDTLGYVSNWVDDQVAALRDALGKYVCALERLYDAR